MRIWKHYFEVITREDELTFHTSEEDMASECLRMCDICGERLWNYCVQPNGSQTCPEEPYHILESIGDDTAPYAFVCEECFNKKFNQYDWIYKNLPEV